MALVHLCSMPSARHTTVCSMALGSCQPLQARSRPHLVQRRNVVCAQQPQAAPPTERVDVSSNCVQPVFRSIPNKSHKLGDEKIRVLFISESNACRSVYAEAMFNNLLKEKELANVVECDSKGTRDYTLGENPNGNVLEVAEDLGLDIKDHSSTVFNCARDVVTYDLLLVMDKKLGDEKIRVLFISESNACRSVYAEAMFNNLLKEKELANVVECNSKGTRDYTLGENPNGNVLEVAEDLGLDIKDHSSTVFNCARDVVTYDLLLVMDKFTASDVLKDVTLFEAIDKSTHYCWKVRRLGEFCQGRKIEDIDDPLYGNVGGEQEVEELHRAALDIHDSCNGLINFLSEIQSSIEETETLKTALAGTMGNMTPIEWIKPPMLQDPLSSHISETS